MKHFTFLLILFCTLALFSCSGKWTTIKEFRFYGNADPVKNPNADFVQGNTSTINNLFSGMEMKKSIAWVENPFYATIIFSNDEKQTIQIMSVGDMNFRTATNDFYYLDQTKIENWKKYIHELNEQLGK